MATGDVALEASIDSFRVGREWESFQGQGKAQTMEFSASGASASYDLTLQKNSTNTTGDLYPTQLDPAKKYTIRIIEQ